MAAGEIKVRKKGTGDEKGIPGGEIICVEETAEEKGTIYSYMK
jgi:hypothetical protein